MLDVDKVSRYCLRIGCCLEEWGSCVPGPNTIIICYYHLTYDHESMPAHLYARRQADFRVFLDSYLGLFIRDMDTAIQSNQP